MKKITDPALTLLLKEKESEYLDFKEILCNNNAQLVHDVLCLSNSKSLSDRYMIFGVADNKIIKGVSGQRKTQADIVDCLRNSNFNRMPDILFYEVKHNDLTLDVLQIKNNPYKPYFLLKDKRDGKVTVRAGVVYTRNNDSNTPINSTASLDQIETMWREKFGLDENPLQRVMKYIHDIPHWKKVGAHEAFYQNFPEFKIVWSSESLDDDFYEHWIDKDLPCLCAKVKVQVLYNVTQLLEFDIINLEDRSFFPDPRYYNIKNVHVDGKAYINKSQIECYICAIMDEIGKVEDYDESFKNRESIKEPLDVYLNSLIINFSIYSLNIQIENEDDA